MTKIFKFILGTVAAVLLFGFYSNVSYGQTIPTSCPLVSQQFPVKNIEKELNVKVLVAAPYYYNNFIKFIPADFCNMLFLSQSGALGGGIIVFSYQSENAANVKKLFSDSEKEFRKIYPGAKKRNIGDDSYYADIKDPNTGQTGNSPFLAVRRGTCVAGGWTTVGSPAQLEKIVSFAINQNDCQSADTTNGISNWFAGFSLFCVISLLALLALIVFLLIRKKWILAFVFAVAFIVLWLLCRSGKL